MRTLLAVLAVSMLALGACTPGEPGVTPTATDPATSAAVTSEAPPTSSSPSPTPTPTPTAQSQEEKDIEAAMKAVTEANRIIDEVLMEPDQHERYPKELEKYVDPASPYWDFQTFGLDSYRRDGERFSVATKIVETSLVGDYGSSEMVIYQCADARDLEILNKDDEVVATGGLSEAHIAVRKTDGMWRAWAFVENNDGDISWTVESCRGGAQ